jgi:ABC-type multidrug transport system fused ATPase/permease subunit
MCEYKHLETEAALDNGKDLPVTKGTIQFDDVSMRYSEGSNTVLRHVSFMIEGGSKIGIVGRTGAGKSSLINALLRLTETDSGVILIDGTDTKTVGLHTLR